MNPKCETCAYKNLPYYQANKCRYCHSVYDDTGDAPEYVDANGVCDGYVGAACIDGTCPNAQEHEEYCCPIPCADCFYNKGCADCAAPEMGLCDKEVKPNGPEV